MSYTLVYSPPKLAPLPCECCMHILLVSVTWQGDSITGPVLIFHDELPSSPRETNQQLSCVSAGASWHLPDGIAVEELGANTPFVQLTNGLGTISGLLRNTGVGEPANSNPYNGLWTCRSNAEATGAIPVGIYERGK